MPGEVDPTLGWIDGAVPAAGLDAGRQRKAGDGVADQLALAATEAANGIAHEQDLGEVFAAQGGTAELLAGAELTLDRYAVVGVYTEIGGGIARRVRAMSSSRALVFILKCHISALVIFRERWEIEELLVCSARVAWIARRADGVDCRAGGRLREEGVEIAKVFLELAKLAGIDGRWRVVDSEGELRLFLFQLGLEDLAGAGNGVALAVEEAFDAEGHLDVATAIETLAGAPFVGLELGEFALPEAQDVGRDVAEFRNFADAEVELVRDV
jgi:hypothetical protein